MAAAGAGAEDDDTAAEPPAAKRGQFPSSLGISLLVPPDAESLEVTARWGDYEPVEREGRVVEWKRTERNASVSVSVASDQSGPSSTDLPEQRRTRDRHLRSTRAWTRRSTRPAEGHPRRIRVPRQPARGRREAGAQGPALHLSSHARRLLLAVPLVPRPNPRGRRKWTRSTSASPTCSIATSWSSPSATASQ